MVKITTLGDFDIIIDGESKIEELDSQKKLIRLFKYFLIHYNEKILPEDILEDLFFDEDSKNPLNLIRTQISRLRNILNKDETSIEPFFEIRYINGYYSLQLEKDYEIDFVEFENTLGKDFRLIKEDIEEDYLSFKNLLFLYKGNLLREITDEDWIIPIRSRFARLYIKGISYYIDYLKERFMYAEIIEICEKAIIVKPYEEIIHLNFMNALIKLDQHSYASLHYEFYTKKIFNDLGIKPSQKLKELYKKIKIKDDTSYKKIDLNKIDSEIGKDFNFPGAMVCDVDYFKFIYSYEKRNKDRRLNEKAVVGVSIITLESNNHNELTKEEINEGMDLLKYTLLRSLRAGDIVSKWNENQVVVLLYGLQESGINAVAEKINDNFNDMNFDKKVTPIIKIDIL